MNTCDCDVDEEWKAHDTEGECDGPDIDDLYLAPEEYRFGDYPQYDADDCDPGFFILDPAADLNTRHSSRANSILIPALRLSSLTEESLASAEDKHNLTASSDGKPIGKASRAAGRNASKHAPPKFMARALEVTPDATPPQKEMPEAPETGSREPPVAPEAHCTPARPWPCWFYVLIIGGAVIV